MSKTSRTPYKKNNEKETCERCGREKKKQVSDATTAISLDNCEQTLFSYFCQMHYFKIYRTPSFQGW